MRSGGIVGVLTLLAGGIAQTCHDDRVVELRVQLGVEQVKEKVREEQVEVERERFQCFLPQVSPFDRPFFQFE